MTERHLSALLSQILVAFTVEFDNEFERRMGEAGYPGARLSLVVWATVMRFLGESPVLVRDIAAEIKPELGCLERWGFVVLDSGRRDGWGSGRGIRLDSSVSLTPKGLTAAGIWPPLLAVIEQRWEKRFGTDAIKRLRESLQRVDGQNEHHLPSLLAGLLTAFQLEFDRESPVPLALCANTLRVLSDKPIPVAQLARLTGGSRETSDIGWQIKPYVVIEPDPNAKRGKVVRLSPRGVKAQETYHRLIAEIEKRWEVKFGKDLRESLQALYGSRLSEGLIPPPGTARAGEQTPALGRRVVAPAARQRMRDLVAQTEWFVSDPEGSLPHYPMWDINRGFGP
jgi:hypothetical protein